MFLKELQEIWMSKNEAKIYETILELGESSVSDIAKKSGIHRRNIYDTITRLSEKGVVFSIFWWKENTFGAAEPQKLREMLHEKQQTFEKILPYLEDMRNKQPPTEAAFIYKWIEGYKNYMRDLANIAEDCYFLWAKGNWLTPGVSPDFQRNFERIMEIKWKKTQIIFDPRVKVREDIQNSTNWEYRFLPEWYETPWVVDVFWDYVVTFKWDGIGNFWENGTIFVMVNAQLAESYRTWFKFIWNACENY